MGSNTHLDVKGQMKLYKHNCRIYHCKIHLLQLCENTIQDLLLVKVVWTSLLNNKFPVDMTNRIYPQSTL